MNYKEKYKEALERAKSFQEKYGGDYAGYIFPELAESEEERIRKWLIDYFREVGKSWIHRDISPEQIVAYLEKQKEQKPVEIHVDNPNVEKFDPDVKITTSDSSADGKELLYVCNKSYDIGFRDGVACVKSAEWSEEDEANRTFILESLEDQIRFCKKDAKGAYYTKQIRTAQNWLKSLSLNLKKKNEDVAKLCSNE